MSIQRRLAIAIASLIAVVVIGTIGFVRTEGLPAFEALYLTINTITTVGFGDIVPVTTAGRLLAMVLVITGFTFFTAVVVTAIQLVLERREQERREQQLSTLTTLFFSEIGDGLIQTISRCDPDISHIRKKAENMESWTEMDFDQLAATLKKHSFHVDPKCLDTDSIKQLCDKPLLLKLLENPHVFDNALFNGLIRGIFHFRDELTAHRDLARLGQTRLDHLSTDLKKVYQPLAKLWVAHMRYLNKIYPILFLTLLETNPFIEPPPNTTETAIEK